MKPLLRPAGTLHPDIIHEMLGLSAATSSWGDRQEFDARRCELLELLQTLVGGAKIFTRSEQEGEHNRFYGTYELESSSDPSICFGNVTLSFSGSERRGGHMGASILWSAVSTAVEEVVRFIDLIWFAASLDTFYAYDQVDFRVQNVTWPLGMEYYGLDESQVEFIKKGPVTEIDTRHNPGYFENRDGLHITIQWLNYWSTKTQNQLFGGRMPRLPAGAEIVDLPHGAVRVRVAERPGRYDDVAFHELQLECRRRLGLQK